jgi:hypothetical protein
MIILYIFQILVVISNADNVVISDGGFVPFPPAEFQWHQAR